MRLHYLVILCAVILFGSSCAGPAQNGQPLTESIWADAASAGTAPYSVSLECREITREIGRPIRISMTSGEVVVGTLRSVDCQAPSHLTMTADLGSDWASTTTVSLKSISDIVVLEESQTPEGSAVLTGVLFGTILGVVGLIVAYGSVY